MKPWVTIILKEINYNNKLNISLIESLQNLNICYIINLYKDVHGHDHTLVNYMYTVNL